MIKPNQDLKVRQPLTKTMVSKNSHSHFKTKQRIYFIIFLLLVSLSLIILALSFHDPNPINNNKLSTSQRISQKDDHIPVAKHPEWLKIIEQKLRDKKKKIKLGLVNLDHDHHGLHDGLKGLDRVETVSVRFDRLTGDNKREWEEYFPEWIDEHHKWGPPRCPEIPLPTSLEQYNDLDVVVASVPCGTNYTRKGVRDVFRLQVNLVAANLAVRSGWENQGVVHRTVYVVFVGSCGPMLEIFRCDDLVKHRKGEYWVYWPEMRRLKQKVLMPVGSCQLAPGYAETGEVLVPFFAIS
ncbi:hypothetical protein L484_000802 [Morus notabilis]|uniref:Uncharacterized protein n=3 Tax=Morus notabilis TaxID=981085 RepID=W9SNV0_9ROSA|nr:hypothetical protein L484_000802 [Morus notabilis]